jgi:hypothetical protein
MAADAQLPFWILAEVGTLYADLEVMGVVTGKTTEVFGQALEVYALLELFLDLGKMLGDERRIIFMAINTIERLLFGLFRMRVVIETRCMAFNTTQGLVVRIQEVSGRDMQIDESTGDCIAVTQGFHAVASHAIDRLSLNHCCLDANPLDDTEGIITPSCIAHNPESKQ